MIVSVQYFVLGVIRVCKQICQFNNANPNGNDNVNGIKDVHSNDVHTVPRPGIGNAVGLYVIFVFGCGKT